MPIYSTACPRNCYSTCSFRVHVADNKIVNIDPHPDNRATPEGVCLKGLSYVERANSPDRILHPLRKDAQGNFQQITWDEALSLIADRMAVYKKTDGSHSILFLASSGMSGLTNQFSGKFWKLFGGTTSTYGNLCWPAGLEATRLTLGENKHNAPWDLEHAQLIVMWGKNAVESNIHQMLPLNKALDNGAKFIVIDPRRTPSSERASVLIQPQPGTDAYLALAIANTLIRNQWIDHDFVQQHVLGFDAFAEEVKQYTIPKASQVCDIPEDFIEQLAYDIGHIRPMTLIPGYGMQRYSNGGQTMRALLALSVLTGNIGKQGACWHYANLQSYVFDDVKEPENYYPSSEADHPFRRTISMAKLGDDMLAAHSPKLRMAWVERANPLSSNPDTNTIRKAFEALDFRVVVDQFMTDTAAMADIILPAKNMFEQSDIIGSYWNPYVQLKPKVIEPAGEVKPETEIYYLLAQRLGMDQKAIDAHLLAPTDKAVDDFLENELAKFPELSMKTLRNKPQIANSHEEIAFADMKFATPSGKIELYSQQAVDKWGVNPIASFEPIRENHKNSRLPFYLMTPNTKNRIHSQFNNLKIIQAFSPHPTVSIHPADAALRLIEHDSMVKVFNDRGYFELKATLDYGMRRGCLAISNGWWASQGGSTNFLSKGRETDMGHGTAFHDNMVDIKSL